MANCCTPGTIQEADYKKELKRAVVEQKAKRKKIIQQFQAREKEAYTRLMKRQRDLGQFDSDQPA